MKDVLPVAAQWVREGRAFAAATVVGVHGSAPRELGATMLVGADGVLVGNVSGGCVEGAVAEAGFDALDDGVARVLTYGIPDDPVFGVGLTCGGVVDVLVRPVRPGTAAARELCALDESRSAPLALVLVVSGDGVGASRLIGRSSEAGEGAGDEASILRMAYDDARAHAGDDRAHLLAYDRAGCRTEVDPTASVLVIPFGAPAHLVIVGAVAFATALARLGAALGLRVTVVDARSAFAVPERFPGAEVVVERPDVFLARTAVDATTAVAVLTHDPKFDVPTLRIALASPAGYVGAMGSRRTHDDRTERLRAAGVSAEQLARLRSPIGLDLGGRTPEETALSILAEIVAVRHGASGSPLSTTSGSIHPPTPTAVAGGSITPRDEPTAVTTVRLRGR